MRRLGAGLLVGAIIRVGAAAAAQGERAEYRIDNLSLFCKRGSATECTRENVAQQRNDCHARPLRSTLAERSHLADAMGSRNRRQTERRAAAKEPKVSVSSATPAAPALIVVAPLWGRRRPASNFCFGSNSDDLRFTWSRPLHPADQTKFRRVSTSATGQEQTYELVDAERGYALKILYYNTLPKSFTQPNEGTPWQQRRAAARARSERAR